MEKLILRFELLLISVISNKKIDAFVRITLRFGHSQQKTAPDCAIKQTHPTFDYTTLANTSVKHYSLDISQ